MFSCFMISHLFLFKLNPHWSARFVKHDWSNKTKTFFWFFRPFFEFNKIKPSLANQIISRYRLVSLLSCFATNECNNLRFGCKLKRCRLLYDFFVSGKLKRWVNSSSLFTKWNCLISSQSVTHYYSIKCIW